MSESAPKCVHSPYAADNTLIVESHWSANTRIRCSLCGGCAYISKHGKIEPETCDCHKAAPEPSAAISDFAAAVINFKTQQLARLQAELDGFKKLWGVKEDNTLDPLPIQRLQMIADAAKDGASLTWIRAVAEEGLRGEPLVELQTPSEDIYTRKIATLTKARTCTHCTCAFFDADGTENPGSVCQIHPNGCKHGKPWYVACMPCRNELWGKTS